MKKLHPAFWLGLGGILAFALSQFTKDIDWRINFYPWMAIMIGGSVITAQQNKKAKEEGKK